MRLSKFSISRFLLFTLLILYWCCSVFSQSYHFRNYSVDEGLPFIQVSAIFQDQQGNLWTGGYGGLSKFDGTEFTNYSTRDGLVNHSVTSIAQDDSGNIWIGTISGLNKFNGKHFVSYTVKDGLPGDAITSIIYDSNANLWIGTKNGVSKYDGQQFINYTVKDGLPGNEINTIYETTQDEIWLGTNHGAAKFNGENFELFSVKNGLCDSVITTIIEDDKGNIWLGTRNGITVYNDQRTVSYNTTNGLPDNNITAMRMDAKKNIWAGTTKGVCKFDKQSTIHSKAFKVYHPGKDNNSDLILSLFVDYEGNLWIGTYSGMFRYRGDGFVTYNESDGLTNTFTYPILRDKAGNFLVGTGGGGLFRHKDGRFINLGKEYQFPGINVNCFFEDGDRVWVGTDKGFSIYQPAAMATGSKAIFTNFFKKDGLIGDSVNFILKDHTGNYWLGGQNGITFYDGKKFSIHRFKSKLTTEFGVFSILEDSSHHLWLGTWPGGLFKYDGKEIKEYGSVIGLKSASIFSILKDRGGRLYFGTLEGVFMYDGERLVEFSQADGMSSDLVYCMILTDNDHTLWVGTNQGINKIDLEEFHRSGKKMISHYGKEDGFMGVECNSNGCFKDTDGCIWFGTVNGLVKYNPSEFQSNAVEAKTAITTILLFGKDTLLEQGASLPYHLNHISFRFKGISLTEPGKVQYRYILEGIDKQWSNNTSYNFADYTNLPPGKYTFRVRSSNSDGHWNFNSVSFRFEITAPFWKTWWFWITLTGSITAILVLGLKYRIRQVRKREQAELKQKIEIAGYELKALRSQMNPHFIFNSLNSIQSFILTSDEQSAVKYLNKFAKLIRIILNNSEKSSVTVREELDAIRLYLELEQLRFENKFDYTITIDKLIDIDYYEIPAMLIQPYIENAILHGIVPKETRGKLSIELLESPGHLICIITDDGIGRKKSEALKKQSTRANHGSMGMKITRDRLEMINRIHHSKMNVVITDLEENGVASGTKVEIYIPIV